MMVMKMIITTIIIIIIIIIIKTDILTVSPSVDSLKREKKI